MKYLQIAMTAMTILFMASAPARAQYTDAVAVCGADPTGITDSTAAITSCIATYSAVSFPTGTFQACGVPVSNSSAVVVGTGAVLSPQLPAPAGPGGTVFTCGDATSNIFTLSNSPGSPYVSVYMQGFSCTRPDSVTPTAGSCVGYAAGTYCVPCTFRDIMSTNQFIGFNVPPGNGLLRDVWAFNNYGDGFYLELVDPTQNMQWDTDRMFATLNSGYGVHMVNISGGGAVIGHWSGGTFANGLGGLLATSGTTQSSINDWIFVGWGASDENGDCMHFDNTNGGAIVISNSLIEACGRPPFNVGRNQSVPPAHAGGNGVNFTRASGAAMISDNHINGTASSGIGVSGTMTSIVLGTNTLFDDGNQAGACGSNCNAITIFATGAKVTVTGNIVEFTGTPVAAWALLDDSPLSSATGNTLQNGSSGSACGGTTYAKAGNVAGPGVGTGC